MTILQPPQDQQYIKPSSYILSACSCLYFSPYSAQTQKFDRLIIPIKAVFIFHCCIINFHKLRSKMKHLYYLTMSRSPGTVYVAPGCHKAAISSVTSSEAQGLLPSLWSYWQNSFSHIYRIYSTLLLQGQQENIFEFREGLSPFL